MEKLIRKYGAIVLLYVVVIGGVMLLSSRLKYLNDKETTMQKIAVNTK